MGLLTLRPGDANEVVEEAHRYIVPCLISQPCALSFQPLPTLDQSKYASASAVARGASGFPTPQPGTLKGITKRN